MTLIPTNRMKRDDSGVLFFDIPDQTFGDVVLVRYFY